MNNYFLKLFLHIEWSRVCLTECKWKITAVFVVLMMFKRLKQVLRPRSLLWPHNSTSSLGAHHKTIKQLGEKDICCNTIYNRRNKEPTLRSTERGFMKWMVVQPLPRATAIKMIMFREHKFTQEGLFLQAVCIKQETLTMKLSLENTSQGIRCTCASTSPTSR